jgi:hypothetical protein
MLKGDRIRYVLPKEAAVLVDALRENREEVLQILQEQRGTLYCPIHGARATWWKREDGSPVCGQCHPDLFEEAAKKGRDSGSPSLPTGVKLMQWAPKSPPIAIEAWSLVNDVPLFIRTTLAQLESALNGDSLGAGNWPVRTLVERLEQAGVLVEVPG